MNELSHLTEYIPRRFQDFDDLAASSCLSSLHPRTMPMPSGEDFAGRCFEFSEVIRLPHIKIEERSYWIRRIQVLYMSS